MAARALGTEHRDRTDDDADEAGRHMYGHETRDTMELRSRG